MSLMIASIDILLDTNAPGEAEDAIAEALRPLLKRYGGENTCWIDWRYVINPQPINMAEDFEGNPL